MSPVLPDSATYECKLVANYITKVAQINCSVYFLGNCSEIGLHLLYQPENHDLLKTIAYNKDSQII